MIKVTLREPKWVSYLVIVAMFVLLATMVIDFLGAGREVFIFGWGVGVTAAVFALVSDLVKR